MRVIFYDGKIINGEDSDPQIDRLISEGAEEISESIFNGLANYASNKNTYKSGSTWVFNDEIAENEKQANIQEAKDREDSRVSLQDRIEQQDLVINDLKRRLDANQIYL